MLIVSATDSDKGYSVRPHDPRPENPAGKSTAESQVSLVFLNVWSNGNKEE